MAQSLCAFGILVELLTGPLMFASTLALDEPEVVIAYQGPTALTLGEPVVVTFSATNHLPEPARLDLGYDRKGGFILRIRTTSGSVVNLQLKPDPSRVAAGGISRIRDVLVPAGETYSQQLVLNDWFAFDDVGSYEVSIRLDTPVRAKSGSSIDSPTTGRLRFRIAPRDESTLRTKCMELAVIAETASNAQTFLEAAHALSSIQDPVAVPCLQYVLQNTDRVDFTIIHALARIGGDEARAVLQLAAQSGDEERAAIAQNALSRFPPHSRK